MASEESPGGMQINRVFEQPPDAISMYADVAQVIGTGNEVVLQFYETIPGTPGPGGQIQLVRTRLRATITLSIPHAINIGSLLMKQAEKGPVIPQAKNGEKQP
jgi:hypothetical protein